MAELAAVILWGGFLVGLVLCAVAGFVLALVALRRTREIPRLTRRLADVEREVHALRRTPPGEPARPAEPPAAVEPVASTPEERPAAVREAPPPPPRPAPPPPRFPPTAPPRAPIDWERWFGVRAAAVLGGVALALAGLLFFRYSIEHGFIPPWLRVVLGTVVGVASIAGSERALRRRYPGTANALGGAGVVILYAAFWAARVRYGLVPLPAALVLMVAVTAVCCMLSWRHRSQLIALLGLVGGFATPYLLAGDADRPFGLFGYLLLLDTALLYLAQARRWPVLAGLSLGMTILYEALWMGTRMGTDRLHLGLGILAVFALLFLLAGRLAREEDRAVWRWTQAAGVLVPFAFALHLAGQARFGPQLLPFAWLLLVLVAGAGGLGHVQGDHRLGLGAAGGSLGVVAAWLLTRSLDARLAWEAVAVCVALAAAFHAFVEWEPGRADARGPAPAAIVSALGFFFLLALAVPRHLGPPWPWLAGWTLLTTLLLRHAGLPAGERLHVAAAMALGLALAWLLTDPVGRALVWRLTPVDVASIVLPLRSHCAIMLAAALAFQGVALRRREPAARRWAEHAAAAIAAILVVALMIRHFEPPPLTFLGTALCLGLLVALAATRLGNGAWLLAAVAATALAHSAWLPAPSRQVAAVGLAIQAAAVVLFTGWPFLIPARLRGERLAWRAAALAGPAWFHSLRRLFVLRFGAAAIGVLPLALAAVALAALLRMRDVFPTDDRRRTDALAWFAAVALGFVSIAIPLQLEKEWITIGWALEGVSVIYLWTRLEHAGLKWFGLVLLGAATVRLVGNPAVLGYYPRSSWRVVNWLLYTYLVPAAALLGAATLLAPREVARATAWEREHLYSDGRPVGALACGLGGLVAVFVWINLAIADWFAVGPMLTVTFERLPARDLATSIAWALYALALLAAGMVRASTGLRWASLALLLMTIAKVFLHDLGELRDLYRVASLAGLAISLLAVSLAYQRFVFRTVAEEQT